MLMDDVQQIFAGQTEVERVYAGESEVWRRRAILSDALKEELRQGALVDAVAKTLHASVSYSGGTNGLCRQKDGTWIANPNPVRPRWSWNEAGTEQVVLCEPAATNILTNSTTGGTVAVTAVAYTVAFSGTGSIALTGAHTATVTPVAGERASLTFTPAAGNLVITPMGDVTLIQLETGTVATSPIPTNGAAVTRAADDFAVDTTVLGLEDAGGTVVARVIGAPTDGPSRAVFSGENGREPLAIQYGGGVASWDGATSVIGRTPDFTAALHTAVSSWGTGRTISTESTADAMGEYSGVILSSSMVIGNNLSHVSSLNGEISFLTALKRQATAPERAELVRLETIPEVTP